MSLKNILNGLGTASKPVSSMENDDVAELDVTGTEETGADEGDEASGDDEGSDNADEDNSDDAAEDGSDDAGTDNDGDDDSDDDSQTSDGDAAGDEDADEDVAGDEDEPSVAEDDGDVAGDESSVADDNATAEDEAAEDSQIPVYESIDTDEESAEIMKLNEVADGFESDVNDYDDLEANLSTLDEAHAITTRSVDNGGLNSDGAELLRLVIKVTTSADTVDSITPSAESFGGIHSRTASTEAAGKGIVQMIKGAANSAMDFLLKIYESAKKALLGLFSSEQAIKNSLEKADAASKKGKKTGKVKLSSTDCKALSLDGKVANGGQLLVQYTSTVTTLQKLVETNAPFQFLAELSNIVIDTSSDEAFKKSYENLKNILKKFPIDAAYSKDVNSEFKELSDANLDVKSTELMLGEARFVGASIKGEISGVAHGGKQFVRFDRGETAKEATIDGIAAADMGKLANTVEAALAIIEKSKEKAKDLDKAIADVKKLTKTISTAGEKADTLSNDSKSELKEVLTAMRKVCSSLPIQLSQSSILAVTVTKAMLKVANRSYGGGEDDSNDTKALPNKADSKIEDKS